MPLVKLQFAPGINREVSNYANEGGWYDCNRIRFRGPYPETIGGWTRVSSAATLGRCRALLAWRDLGLTQLLAIGTELKYYINRGGGYFDITPIRRTTAAGAVTFSATTGSNLLTVTDTGHGALAGDFVTFSGASGLGGAVTASVLNAEYRIDSVIGANSYRIVLPVTATGSDTGNGGAFTVAAYQINVGLDTAVVGTGWGAGPWGSGGWGSPADATVAGAQLRIWSHTAYGEDLVFCARGGPIYYWDRSGGLSARGVDLTSLAGANRTPTMGNVVLLSERDRHLIVFGCDDEFTPGVMDPLLIRFSSQESLVDWESRPTNTAGSLRLSSGSAIITAVQTRQQILVLTDSSASSMQFIGPPFTFGIAEVASGTSVAGPNAAVSIGDEVLWMGRSEFYRFSGVVQQLPCAVWSYVFNDLNTDQLWKVCAGHNTAFGEVWWFYPSAASDENDRYVVYNYLQNVWYYGALARTAWLDRGVFQTPVAAHPDGLLFYHETGLADGETSPPQGLNAFIESSPVDLGEGDDYMFLTRMLPDVDFSRSEGPVDPSVRLVIKMRNFPGGRIVDDNTRTVTRTATVPVTQFTEQVFLRLRGRSAIFRIESDCACTAWRLGAPRVDVRTDGGRA